MANESKISDNELEGVSGGAGGWEKYARGTYVNYGNYIVYTIAPGDVISGIALRFGVTGEQIKLWNKLRDINVIYAGQKLTIYPSVLR